MADNCLNCEHFRPHGPEVPEGYGIGRCERYPPLGVPHSAVSHDHRFPNILEPGHCGEWLKKGSDGNDQ